MIKWKNVLLGFALALALPLAAAGATAQSGMDTPNLVPPPTSDGTSCALPEEAAGLPGATESYRCCWFYHGGLWWCVLCSL